MRPFLETLKSARVFGQSFLYFAYCLDQRGVLGFMRHPLECRPLF